MKIISGQLFKPIIQCFIAPEPCFITKNYREKSHYCLIEAIRTLYIEKGIIGYWLIEALQKAKTLREGADYYSEFSKEGVEDLIKKAKEFLEKAEEILK